MSAQIRAERRQNAQAQIESFRVEEPAFLVQADARLDSYASRQFKAKFLALYEGVDIAFVHTSIGRRVKKDTGRCQNACTRRLGKSPRWLQSRLTEDARRGEGKRQLQHHHFVGRSKRWSETEYKALEAAIVAEDRERALDRAARPGSRSPRATASGTSSAPSPLPVSTERDALAALERVLAFPQRPTSAPQPRR